jgi:hypothetical protein
MRVNSAGALGMLVMLFGLAVLGIINSLSSDSLVVSGGIQQAGGIHADWECSWTNDDGVQTPCGGFGSEPAADDGLDQHGSFAFPYATPFVEKDVGSCDASVPPPDDSVDDQVATVAIAVAYPSYECTFTLVISNSGTEPFTIGGWQYSFQISACPGPCDGSIIQRAGLFGNWRGAPAEISFRLASEER